MTELAPTAQAMCRYVVTSIVDDTEAVQITASSRAPARCASTCASPRARWAA